FFKKIQFNKMCCGGRLKSAVPAEKISQILPLLSTSENQGGHFVDILACGHVLKMKKCRIIGHFLTLNYSIPP
ncbi:MAG: hypothetical protein IJW25_03485, partial [Clostridia bacterium]|nr:hypothetical protein [Clostridia bacterium]